MLPSATLWKRAVIARLSLLRYRNKPQKKTAQRAAGQADKNCSSPACRRTKPIKTAQRAINCAERKGRQFLPSSCFRFSFEREIFRSDKSFLFRTTFGVRHFFSALSGSFGHLCTSRNARVTGFALRGHQVNPRRARSFGDCIITCRRPRRLTTLSPQTCTKSLTQSCLALSVRSISIQLAKCKMSGKDPLKTAYLFDRLREHKSRPRQKQTAQRADGQADKKRQQFFAVVCLSVRSS